MRFVVDAPILTTASGEKVQMVKVAGKWMSPKLASRVFSGEFPELSKGISWQDLGQGKYKVTTASGKESIVQVEEPKEEAIEEKQEKVQEEKKEAQRVSVSLPSNAFPPLLNEKSFEKKLLGNGKEKRDVVNVYSGPVPSSIQVSPMPKGKTTTFVPKVDMKAEEKRFLLKQVAETQVAKASESFELKSPKLEEPKDLVKVSKYLSSQQFSSLPEEEKQAKKQALMEATSSLSKTLDKPEDYEFWIDEKSGTIMARHSKSIQVSSPIEASVVASKYNVDYKLVKIGDNLYDFIPMNKLGVPVELPKERIDYAYVPLKDQEWSKVVVSGLIKEKNLVDVVKEKGLKGLVNKLTANEPVELKEGYHLVSDEGKNVYLVKTIKDEKDRAEMLDYLSKKYDEFSRQVNVKSKVKMMADVGTPFEKALVYGSAFTSPIEASVRYLKGGKQELKRFGEEETLKFAQSKSWKEALTRGAFQTETGAFSSAFVVGSGVSSVANVVKGMTSARAGYLTALGKTPRYSTALSAGGRVVGTGMKVAYVVSETAYLTPQAFQAYRTGEWTPFLKSVKMEGLKLGGFILGSRKPIGVTEEFARKSMEFKESVSTQPMIEKLGKYYAVGTKLSVVEPMKSSFRKIDVKIGSFVTPEGRIINRMPSYLSYKTLIYPIPFERYVSSLHSKDFGVKGPYIEWKSPSLVEYQKKLGKHGSLESYFRSEVVVHGPEGKPVFGVTRQRYELPTGELKEKYLSFYQTKDVEETLKNLKNLRAGFVGGQAYKDKDILVATSKYMKAEDLWKNLVKKSFMKEGYRLPREQLERLESGVWTSVKGVRFYYLDESDSFQFFRKSSSLDGLRDELKRFFGSEKGTVGKLKGISVIYKPDIVIPETVKVYKQPSVGILTFAPRLSTLKSRSQLIQPARLSLVESVELGASAKVDVKPESIITSEVKVIPSLKLLTELQVKPKVIPELTPSVSVTPVPEAIPRATPELVPRVPTLPLIFSRKSGGIPSVSQGAKEVKIKEIVPNLKKVMGTAYPDFWSAVVSQARYGKATAPRFTPKQLETLRRKGYIRVPTKEYMKNKVLFKEVI